ncbi:hypothetical protein TNCT_194301 [Trichonephila clavata]|uniref:Uncharacterized protein n=1 Tax=Trichonephila clavata TaxID=2740835 RepID=A0A8X6F5A9_TRICU|nr:hypothetical protein TNCT_194301 [Trichonephila clavata]
MSVANLPLEDDIGHRASKKGNGVRCNNELPKGFPIKTSSILKGVRFHGEEHFSRETANTAQRCKPELSCENLHILAPNVKCICTSIKY